MNFNVEQHIGKKNVRNDPYMKLKSSNIRKKWTNLNDPNTMDQRFLYIFLKQTK